MARHELRDEPANGTLQWNVLLAAALCPPPPGAHSLAKKKPQGERTQSDCGCDVWNRAESRRDPRSTPFFGAVKIPVDATTSCVRASDQECRDQALSPITDRPATPRGERSGGLRPTPTNSPSVPRVPFVRGPTARAAWTIGRRSGHLRPKCALAIHTIF